MEILNLSKEELIDKIVSARIIAKRCHDRYGGSRFPFLAGAYEAVFAELIGVDNLKAFLEKVGR